MHIVIKNLMYGIHVPILLLNNKIGLVCIERISKRSYIKEFADDKTMGYVKLCV